MPSVESDEQAEASTAENAQTATDIFRLTAKIYLINRLAFRPVKSSHRVTVTST